MPRYSVLEVENYSVYKHSFVGLKLSKNNEYKDEQDKKPDNDHAAEVKTNFTVSLKSPLYWQFLICFTILSFRIKSIQGILKSSDFFFRKNSGWIYSWIDWTYSEANVDPKFVSDVLDIYGYLIFLAPLVAVLPGMVFGTAERCTGSKQKGDLFGLIILYCSVCIGCTSKAVELPLTPIFC